MRIAVLVKQVPDPSDEVGFDPATLRLDRSGTPVMDPGGGHAVEAALQLSEQAEGGCTVTVVSMAPGGVRAGLRTPLAMGADEATVVSDPRLEGCDALGTAKVLAGVVGRLGADLVVAATESADSGTGLVPLQLAELLDMPAVTGVDRASLVPRGLELGRQTRSGVESLSCPLPAVITVSARGFRPRYATFAGLVAARSKPVAELGLFDLGLVDLARERPWRDQEVLTVAAGESRGRGRVVEDEAEGVALVLARLGEEGLL